MTLPTDETGAAPVPAAYDRPFDAAVIADFAREEGADPLAAVIGQLAGYASVCWESMAGTGTFDSTAARAAVDSTLGWLRRTVGEDVLHRPAPPMQRLEPGERALVLLGEGGMRPEDVAELKRWFAGGTDNPVAVLDGAVGVVVVPPAEVTGEPQLVQPGGTLVELEDGCVGEHSPVNAGCRYAPGDIYAGEREAAAEGRSQGCPASMNIAGEHVWCTLQPGHDGWAHANSKHEVIWRGEVGMGHPLQQNQDDEQ